MRTIRFLYYFMRMNYLSFVDACSSNKNLSQDLEMDPCKLRRDRLSEAKDPTGPWRRHTPKEPLTAVQAINFGNR